MERLNLNQMTKKRIIGVDVARAFAIMGMIIVNFKIVLGEVGDNWVNSIADFFSGKAAALFVVLAGVGLTLMTKSAVETQNLDKLKTNRKRILKRVVFLFVMGLSWIWIWPADILHYYGVYMLITLFFVTRPNSQILLSSVLLISVFPILMLLFDYEKGWVLDFFYYLDFWTVEGFFRNLFFNGFHPVIPWVAFMLFGLWFGRQDLNDNAFLKRSLKVGLVVFGIIQVLIFPPVQKTIAGNSELLSYLFSTEPMPPFPLYMISGIATSVVVLSICILVSKRYENNWVIQSLNRTGQLALTFYVAHVILGMGFVIDEDLTELGTYSIEFSVLYALGFSLFCMVFATIWLKYKKSGPIEWVMRKLTN